MEVMDDDIINKDFLNDKLFSNSLGIMKRYPFHGSSKYLIDKFFIIGYDYPTLNKILIEQDLDFMTNSSKTFEILQFEKNKNIYPQEFEISEPPSLINEISSDYTKKVLDIDIIIGMIFPNKPRFYYAEEEISQNDELPINCNLKKNPTFKEEKDDTKKTKSASKDDILDSIYEDVTSENDLYNKCNNSEKKKKDIRDKKEIRPKSYNVVFSSNPQLTGNEKKSVNGIAHVFYKKFIENKTYKNMRYSFYVPVVFCIISEFPYYNGFYNLMLQIMHLFQKKIIELPLEIHIQNIVNFTLSPLNDDVVIKVATLSFLNLWKTESSKFTCIEEVEEEKEHENEIEKKKIELKSLSPDKPNNKKKENQNNNKYLNQTPKFSSRKLKKSPAKEKTKFKGDFDVPIVPGDMHKTLKPRINNNSKKIHIPRGSRSDKEISTFSRQLVTNLNNKSFSNLNTKFTDEEEKCNNEFELIRFEFLRGYPLINYNLSKVLLNSLSTYDVIQIFLYSFLEKDIIFFSTDIELLSLTINSYLNLNFPLNDEKYYFTNACVSYNDYVNNNSTFVGSTFTTIVGINDQYQSKYMNNSSHKLGEHLAVDLDNGCVYEVIDPNDKDARSKNKLLFDLIKKIYKTKETKDEKESSTILGREIRALIDELNECKSKILNDNDFSSFSYIDYNKNIHEINLEIQESFYRFINNICIYFYQNLIITIENDNKTKSLYDFIKTEYDSTYSSNENYIKEEINLLDELKDTMKFQSFIYGFIQSYNPIDLYKIPLTFTEEFVSILSRKSNMELKNIKFLKLFDNLYRKNPGRIDIDFVPFFSTYFTKYKKFFDREIQNYNQEEKKSKKKFNLSNRIGDRKIFNYSYTWYELDNNLILKYNNLLKNLEKDDYSNLFHFQLLNLQNNKIKEVLVSDIENEVEKYAIESNILTKSDLCCGNIILLFALTLKVLSSYPDIQSFLYVLFDDYTIFRKYYAIIMNMTYKLMEECIKNEDYSHANDYLLYCYYSCINRINEKKIVPNENLMNTIKKFNSINIDILTKKAEECRSKNMCISDNYNEKDNKNEINEKNLFVCYNFIHNKIISEKIIIEKINNDIENYNKQFSVNKIKPKIFFKMGKRFIKSDIYPQIEILDMLTKEYNEFNKDLDTNKINSRILLNCTMNIFLFLRYNSENEKGIKIELFDILCYIFHVYLAKVLEKEKEMEIESTKEKEKETKTETK